MKQLIRLLFLCLAIVFSFGFTVSTSPCQKQDTETHSCCQQSKKHSSPKKCKGDCCVQANTVTKIEEVEQVSEVKLDLRVVSSIKVYKNCTTSNVISKKLVDFAFYKNPVLNKPSFVQSCTQNWLI